MKNAKSSVNELWDMFTDEEKLLLDSKMGWRVRRDMSCRKEGRHRFRTRIMRHFFVRS